MKKKKEENIIHNPFVNSKFKIWNSFSLVFTRENTNGSDVSPLT